MRIADDKVMDALTLVVDTREQLPLALPNSQRGTLKVGDVWRCQRCGFRSPWWLTAAAFALCVACDRAAKAREQGQPASQ